MSLLEVISLPRFLDRFLLNMFLNLDMCAGHVSWKQFLTRILGQISWTGFWDMFFGQQRRKGHKIWKQNRNHAIRNHAENTTARASLQRKHGRHIHCHLLMRILSLTHLFRLTCSPSRHLFQLADLIISISHCNRNCKEDGHCGVSNVCDWNLSTY